MKKMTQFRKAALTDRKANGVIIVGYAYGYFVDGTECIIMAPTKARLQKVAHGLGHSPIDMSKARPSGIFRILKPRKRKT